jgi:DNA-binding LacI/PurR family transcriptional regulator
VTRQPPDPSATRSGPRGTRLADVATRAGVSVKTVSNVVNGYAHVSADTRARVDAAIAELDYRPNLAARHLRSGRSGIVALALPELDFPYFAELARHVVEAARQRGWTVLIDQTDGERERERLAMESFGTRLIDGVILSPLATGPRDLAARRATTPMVLLGERVYDGPDDHVSIDNVAAARLAVEHLVGHGRRRIAAVGTQAMRSAGTARLRAAGYREALRDAGLSVVPELMIPAASYHGEHGAAAVDPLLALPEPPDAIFCFNDLLALGALRRLHEKGVRVPDDVAVVGIDDIEDGRYSVPSLTTVRPDKQRIAELAVRLLADRLEAPEAEAHRSPRELDAPFDLVVRESTGGWPSR